MLDCRNLYHIPQTPCPNITPRSEMHDSQCKSTNPPPLWKFLPTCTCKACSVLTEKFQFFDIVSHVYLLIFDARLPLDFYQYTAKNIFASVIFYRYIKYIHNKHIDASVKERPQPYLFPQKKFLSVFYAINIFNTIYYFKPTILIVRRVNAFCKFHTFFGFVYHVS